MILRGLVDCLSLFWLNVIIRFAYNYVWLLRRAAPEGNMQDLALSCLVHFYHQVEKFGSRISRIGFLKSYFFLLN